MSNLTGVWKQVNSSTDSVATANSGTTYIRQYDGSKIAWCSVSGVTDGLKPQWVNIAYGSLDTTNNTISLNVADVDAGVNENYSTISLSVSSDGNTLTLSGVSNGDAYSDVSPNYGDYTWTR